MLYSAFTFAQSVDSVLVFHWIDSLDEIQGNYSDATKLDSALVYVNKALNVTDQYLGKDHIRSAYLLHSKGFILLQLRRFDESEFNFKESLRIKEMFLGAQHKSDCVTLNDLGNLYLNKRDASQGEEYSLKSKICFENAGDTLEMSYGYALNNLAIVYKESGRLHLSEKTLLKAIKVKEAAPYWSNLDIIYLPQSYSLLADVYAQLGDYPRMEKAKSQECFWLLKESKESEIHYYWRRNNLGNKFIELGEFEKAALVYKEAVDGKKALLGAKDPDVAMSLLNLGNALSQLRQYAEAIEIYHEAYSIFALDSVRYTLNLGWVLNNLGLSSMAQGDYQKARSYTQRSLQKKEQTIGTDNTDWNGTNINLILIDIAEGNYETAESKILDRLAFSQQHLPEYKYTRVECLSTLAHMYAKQQDALKSKPYLEALLEEDKIELENISKINIPSSISTYLQRTGINMDRYLSLPYINPISDTSYTNNCYNLALYYKGFLLRAMEELRKSMQNTAGFSDITDSIRYIAYQLNEQYTRNPIDHDVVVRLEAQMKTAESSFALAMPTQIPFQKNVDWKNIHAALGNGEAAIEFLRFNLNRTGSTDNFMYVALLLTPEYESPQYIPLFEENEILTLFANQSGSGRGNVQRLYCDSLPNKLDFNFYTLIWEPIKKFLDGIKVIYYSPGGLLHKINLNALEDTSGKLISDQYEMILLGSTNEIIATDLTEYSRDECVLLGAIDYKLDSVQNLSDVTVENSWTVDADFSSDISVSDPSFRGDVWSFIPGTKEEIETIYKIIVPRIANTTVWRSSEAHEENFKSLSTYARKTKSPWIIHISTHGYFFRDPKVNHTAFQSISEPVYKLSDHPLIRSGLILAGGNFAWKHGHPYKPGMEDGILTAYEISQMDLSNTELVVLSACETGLGDIQGNEGVYGLQRAFKIAGVKNLIMSLWKVPDAATAELMISFYKHWLEDKMTIRQALYNAQKELRDEGFEPFYWAGWVLVE
jgi:CHAT domain-containing protein/tetratricopeptide (TPR) repeat protein